MIIIGAVVTGGFSLGWSDPFFSYEKTSQKETDTCGKSGDKLMHMIVVSNAGSIFKIAIALQFTFFPFEAFRQRGGLSLLNSDHKKLF